jgi:hypothetical protein
MERLKFAERTLISGRIGFGMPNAHHHPPESTTAEGKFLEAGRVNDDVRPSQQSASDGWLISCLRLLRYN